MAVSQSLTLTQKSQSITNNTSTVRILWTSTQTGESWNGYTRTAYYYVSKNGGTETKYSVSYTLPKASTKTIVDKTITVTHTSSGAGSISVRTYMDTDISAGVVEKSASLTLDTIPRKSTMSVANGTLGTAQTLTVTQKSSSFTHTITATCGTASTTICTKSSSTSISFTPPLTWASQNTTGTSVSVKYTITTYNGSTSVGSNSYTKSCSIPSSVKPSCSVAVSDSKGYADTYGGYVKGYSKFSVVVTPTTSYGSAIASYKTTANGSTYTSASFTTGVLKSSGTLTVKSTVTDKRGRTSAAASKSLTVLAYAIPKVSKLSVARCDSDGTSNNQGEYVKVTFSATVTSLNSKNTAKYVLKYKKTSATTYTSKTLTDYANTYTVTNATYIFVAATDSSYNVTLTVTDDLSSTSKSTNASTAFTLMHWLASGTGMAIGKVAEIANALDVGVYTHLRKNVYIGNKTGYMDGKTGVYINSDGYMHIQRSSSDGNHPHIRFFIDDATEPGAYIGLNSSSGYFNFSTAGRYTFDNSLSLLSNNTGIYGYDTNGLIKNALTPQSSNNNTLVGYGNYYNKSGNTHIYGYDIYHYVANIASPTYYIPYYRQGHGVSIGLNTAGYVTSSGTKVCFTVPLSRPVIGTPAVTAATNLGFVLRQGNSYTHGSTDSVYAKPSSYEATLRGTNCVTIIATFSDTTNVTNNDAIGIYWSGTLTFS